MPKPTTPPPDLPHPGATYLHGLRVEGFPVLNLDTLTLEQVEAMHRVYKLLTAYTNERLKVLRLRQTHGFRIEGSLSIRPEGFAPERLPRPVFDAIRGALVGMARIYNQLPEWARWPKVWRRCAGFDGSCDNEGELMPCPFASDLHGDETLIPLCEKCAELRAREL